MNIQDIAGLIQIRTYLLEINNNSNIVSSQDRGQLNLVVKKIDAKIRDNVFNDNFLNDEPLFEMTGDQNTFEIKKAKPIKNGLKSTKKVEAKKDTKTVGKATALSSTKVKKVPKTFSKEDDEKLLGEDIK